MSKIAILVAWLFGLSWTSGASLGEEFAEWGGVVASYYFSYLDIGLGAGEIDPFLKSIWVESETNDLVFLDYFAQSQEKPFKEEFLLAKYSKGEKDQNRTQDHAKAKPERNSCFLLKVLNPSKFLRLRLFTSFLSASNLSLSISLLNWSQDADCPLDPVPIVSLKNEKIPSTMPIMHYKTHRPNSVSDGQRFYEGFAQQHFLRNLSFQVDPEPLYTVRFFTLPRTGTHIIANSMAQMLEEFFILFPRFHGKLWGTGSFDYKNGEIRSAFKHSRLSISHYVPPEHVPSRVIFTFRDPIEFIDSSFYGSLHQSTSCAYQRAKPGYHKEPLFIEFIKAKILQINQIDSLLYDLVPSPFYIRFDDLLGDPFRTFCDIISFINAFPCELSIGEKVKGVLETQGIRSSYKSKSLQESIEAVNEREKWKGIYEAYGRQMVSMVYNDPVTKKLIEFYEYTGRYSEFFGVEQKPKGTGKTFRKESQDSLERVLAHRERISPKIRHSRKWEKWDLVPQIERIIESDVFKKYKMCEE